MCRRARSIDVVGLRGWARWAGASAQAVAQAMQLKMPPNRRIELADALIGDNENAKPTAAQCHWVHNKPQIEATLQRINRWSTRYGNYTWINKLIQFIRPLSVTQISVSRLPICTAWLLTGPKLVLPRWKQDAQLSQRDRAAGCVIVFANSRTLELGDNDLRTLYVYLQPLSYKWSENLSNSVTKAK